MLDIAIYTSSSPSTKYHHIKKRNQFCVEGSSIVEFIVTSSIVEFIASNAKVWDI